VTADTRASRWTIGCGRGPSTSRGHRGRTRSRRRWPGLAAHARPANTGLRAQKPGVRAPFITAPAERGSKACSWCRRNFSTAKSVKLLIDRTLPASHLYEQEARSICKERSMSARGVSRRCIEERLGMIPRSRVKLALAVGLLAIGLTGVAQEAAAEPEQCSTSCNTQSSPCDQLCLNGSVQTTCGGYGVCHCEAQWVATETREVAHECEWFETDCDCWAVWETTYHDVSSCGYADIWSCDYPYFDVWSEPTCQSCFQNHSWGMPGRRCYAINYCNGLGWPF
jgi:hypothetical protein